VYVKWLFKQNRKSQNPKAERQGQRRREPGARGPGGREQNVSEDWVALHEPHVYKEMLYRVMKPINFDSSKSYPVIVSLHGAGGRGADNLKQLRDWNEVLAEKQRRTDYPAYVVAPQSERRWDTTHLQNVKDIIKDLPSVDMNRIYVLGHSMGGSGTYRFIQADPNYFAAAAISAGGGASVDASVIKDLPVWIFYGDKDRIEGGRIIFKKMQEIGGNMKFTTWVGDGHGVAPKMITGADNGGIQLSGDRCDPEPVFLKWLFKQGNPNPGEAQPRIRPGQQAERQGQRTREPGTRGPGGRGQGGNPVREGWSNGTIPNPDGGALDYQLCNPPQPKPNEKYPVILSMGGTSAARSLYYPDDWRRYPAYVVIPRLPSRDPIHGFTAIKVLIESLPQVDLDRVYIMGWSIGGERTTNFIRKFPNFFAAATPIAGGGLTREVRTPFDAELVKHLPIWAFHGDKDPICSYQYMKDNFNDAAAVGGNFKLTTWVGARHAIVYVKWLFKQNRKSQNPKAERQGQRRREPGARGPGGREQGKYFGQEGWDFEKTMEDPLGGDEIKGSVPILFGPEFAALRLVTTS